MRISKGQKVAVLGLGDTGLSLVRWLYAQGAEVAVADTRAHPPAASQLQREFPQLHFIGGPFDAQWLCAFDLIAVSPGVSLNEPALVAAKLAKRPIVGDVALFSSARDPRSKLIAITGSNGKSTVTSLVGAICQAAGLVTVVAGNIGEPVLNTLSQAVPDVIVLELSSFQLETTPCLGADVAVMLNLSADHLDRHLSMANYLAAKAHVFAAAKHQVINRDDSASMSLRDMSLPCTSFGLDKPKVGEYGLLGEALAYGERRLLTSHELQLVGRHNLANVLAALALVSAIGINETVALRAVREFSGLPHRLQWVASIEGVDYYDDSKGTNVGASIAALQGLPQKVVLIAGGDGKGQNFAPFCAAVAQKASVVVLIGRDAALLEEALLPSGVPLYRATDLEEAVEIAAYFARSGEAVLLSPACASFDMFDNYQQRARIFVRAVQKRQRVTL